MMRLKQLRPIIERFRNALGDEWHVVEREVLARRDGPVLQQIEFGRKSSGVAITSSGAHLLVRNTGLGSEFLLRDIGDSGDRMTPHNHEYAYPRFLKQLYERAEPPISEPLDWEQCLASWEEWVRAKMKEKGGIVTWRGHDCVGLSALHAYRGDDEQAMEWREHFMGHLRYRGAMVKDFQREQTKFMDQLARWMYEGTARVHLRDILIENCKRFSLPLPTKDEV